MRFLLDTNILIPLEDSSHVLEQRLANFIRLARENNHQLLYHPASESDFARDKDSQRRARNLQRLSLYPRLQAPPACPWNSAQTAPNDAADNEILYALKCDAVHALVTEDRGIHDNARNRRLDGRVYTIQTADDWLRRLHDKINVRLPNVEDVPLYSLTSLLSSPFFDSLRTSYARFDDWFRAKAQEGKKAWVVWDKPNELGAVCVYAHQTNEMITQSGLKLDGEALKLCTFKVGPTVRGQKIGELFLKAAFRYATANRLANIFIHGDLNQHHFLFEMLEDFGFQHVGHHPGGDSQDAVYLKKHPLKPPDDLIQPFDFLKSYFPHFRADASVSKYVVPIQPQYHKILFPDHLSPFDIQLDLFQTPNSVGNAIKLAYLCHAQTRQMQPGDIVLFYRSQDERAITSIGIVEQYGSLKDAEEIAALVKRRTVYSMDEIKMLAQKATKVMLFRLVQHFSKPLPQAWLEAQRVLNGAPQSIMKISDTAFTEVWDHGR